MTPLTSTHLAWARGATMTWGLWSATTWWGAATPPLLHSSPSHLNVSCLGHRKYPTYSTRKSVHVEPKGDRCKPMLKAPGFRPCHFHVTNRFQNLLSVQLASLQRGERLEVPGLVLRVLGLPAAGGSEEGANGVGSTRENVRSGGRWWGLADIAHHVIDTHSSPRFLCPLTFYNLASYDVASYDVASYVRV